MSDFYGHPDDPRYHGPDCEPRPTQDDAEPTQSFVQLLAYEARVRRQRLAAQQEAA